MTAFVFKPTNELVGKFKISDAEELSAKLQIFLSARSQIPVNSYVEVNGQSWTITGLEPFELTSGRGLSDYARRQNQKADTVSNERKVLTTEVNQSIYQRFRNFVGEDGIQRYRDYTNSLPVDQFDLWLKQLIKEFERTDGSNFPRYHFEIMDNRFEANFFSTEPGPLTGSLPVNGLRIHNMFWLLAESVEGRLDQLIANASNLASLISSGSPAVKNSIPYKSFSKLVVRRSREGSGLSRGRMKADMIEAGFSEDDAIVISRHFCKTVFDIAGREFAFHLFGQIRFLALFGAIIFVLAFLAKGCQR